VGVKTGSMERCDLRRRGVECEIVGVMREWKIVGSRRAGGQKYDGSVRIWWARERLGVEIGVRMSLFL